MGRTEGTFKQQVDCLTTTPQWVVAVRVSDLIWVKAEQLVDTRHDAVDIVGSLDKHIVQESNGRDFRIKILQEDDCIFFGVRWEKLLLILQVLCSLSPHAS